MSKGLFSRTCTWITMADCHISQIAKSSLPPGNFVLQVDGLDAFADTPSWFDPLPLDLTAEPFGPFAASRRLTEAGDVLAVATSGHTADHVSIVVQDDATTFFLGWRHLL